MACPYAADLAGMGVRKSCSFLPRRAHAGQDHDPVRAGKLSKANGRAKRAGKVRMCMFHKIDDQTYASPQIGTAQIAEAKALGITMIINNRPEDESDDQTPGAEIEAAAKAAGLGYVAIPVTHAGFSFPQVEAMEQALVAAGEGPVLAYCRSGTRSTLLWALTRARMGADPSAIAAAAANAGYDISPIRAQVDLLAAKA
jgi:uncharacterized protein (TIGR01244 family)